LPNFGFSQGVLKVNPDIPQDIPWVLIISSRKDLV
jgi:hypothetical protein